MGSTQIAFKYTFSNFFHFARNFLLYPFSRPARHRLSHSYDALTYPFSGDNSVELSSLLKDDNLQVTIAPLKAREHNTTEFELLSIAGLIRDNQCNTVFEIGTFDGRTTRAIAMNLRDDQGKVFTLNLPPKAEVVSLKTGHVDIELASKVVSGERFLNTPQERFIQQVWGDSAKFDFTTYAGKMDAVFIDGAHSEDYAESDTMNALKMIKPEGGIIIWHDAHLFGVKYFFKNWLKQHSYPVYFIKGTTVAVMGMKNGQPYDLREK
jgi:predicted O-methyltransferase YrrM